MKNQWATIFFLLLFLCGTPFIKANIQDGGEELVIIISKTGDVVCTFEIPKKYRRENGVMLVPFEIVITQKTKQSYTYQSEKTKLYLPDIEGSYLLTVSIGTDVFTYEVED